MSVDENSNFYTNPNNQTNFPFIFYDSIFLKAFTQYSKSNFTTTGDWYLKEFYLLHNKNTPAPYYLNL